LRPVEPASTTNDMAIPDSPSTDALAAGVGPEPEHPGPSGPADLFIAFSKLALSGFGGVMPFAYRDLVERRKWIEAREFAGLLAVAQVLPGPTICNLSIMYGYRVAGLAGSCAAVAGMVIAPTFLVIGLAVLWQRFGGLDWVKAALAGMSAVAIGLIAATGTKMGIGLFQRDVKREQPGSAYWSGRRALQVLLCGLAFAGVGVLRWPLVTVVLILAPVAVAIAWFSED
jgi:chromate transporter